MNVIQYRDNICRICLEDDVWLDWNTSLNQYHDITYKDCYYKYSQLEHLASDPFPQMLCQNCCTDLKSTHALILKALESHKTLQEKFRLESQFQDELKSVTTINSEDGDNPSVEFETILLKEEVISENSCDDINVVTHETIEKEVEEINGSKAVSKNIKTRSKRKLKGKRSLNEPINTALDINVSPTRPEESTMCKVNSPKGVNDIKTAYKIKKEFSEEEVTLEFNLIEYDSIEEEEKAKIESKSTKKYREKPGMCSICSKILRTKRGLEMHEETHIENRERKVTCKICGLKFYNKLCLDSHMQTHKENREKRHKCEFCNKAFYNKGSLNIHRRIHLGQMIPCSLCSKNFYRQIDLERHMSSHSATAINSEAKTQSKYFVRCPHCDKTVRSTTFKSHTAAHLNEPVGKCTICDKEFFSRGYCVRHMKKVHKKNPEEYADFIIMYKNHRMTHLYFQQNTDIQFKID